MSLDVSVQYVKGVGPYIAKLLEKRGIRDVSDLIYHIPARYIDRRQISKIASLEPGKNRTVIGKVVVAGITWIGRKRKKIFEVIIEDSTGAVSGKWFNFYEKYMEGRFRKGSLVLFSGDVTEYAGRKQFIHPDIELLDEEENQELAAGGRVLSIYPSTEGLSQQKFRKIIKSAWDKYSAYIGQYIPHKLLKKYNLMDSREALAVLHFPEGNLELDIMNMRRSDPHRTIIFEELFMLELALHIKNAGNKKLQGIRINWSDTTMKGFESIIPFQLTSAQRCAISEISGDLTGGAPMNRLLQGDVGSGKTIVAFIAATQVIENGYQVAIMAPTEILAEQHFKGAMVYMEKLGIQSALITSSVKGGLREKIYGGAMSGAIRLLFGTHALIQEDLKFKNLGLVIIDEQHRFGVMQRSLLHKKGAAIPHVLVMTATPIPRTLAITMYGELDLSIIDEMPSGRIPIITKLYRENQRQRLYEGMKKELEKGHQIYVVYPLIEESEKIDLKNATKMSAVLKEIFEPRFKVELLHGRMKSEEKDRIMTRFKTGDVHILAATSVVEVGIDVPHATVMVVEHAERFGLSQLHQLRGRVGRSNIQSYCIMVAEWRSSEEARRRLQIMQETNDGFKIAEEDLSIRGPGEFMGTRQSGLPEFYVANVIEDRELLELARNEALQFKLNDCGALKNEVIRRWGKKLELTRA